MSVVYENISLLFIGWAFFCFCFFVFVGVFRTFRAVVVFLFRLRPRSLSTFLPIQTYFATMSLGVTSELVFWARSARILPPVRTDSRPRVLAPLQRIGLIHRQKPVRTLPMPCPRWTKCGLSRQDLYQYHHTRDPPDASSTSRWGSLFTNVAKNAVVLFIVKRNKNAVDHYHVGMRRKCKTITEGDLPSGKAAVLPSAVLICIWTWRTNRFSTGT